MTKAAQSLFVFGLYAILAGTTFLVVPESALSLLHLPPLPAGWARFIGLLALVIGTYDLVCARAGCLAFIRASIFTRTAFAVATVLLAITGQMPASIILLGTIDAAGALWTALALRSRQSRPE